jgi:hypothetical protein
MESGEAEQIRIGIEHRRCDTKHDLGEIGFSQVNPLERLISWNPDSGIEAYGV